MGQSREDEEFIDLSEHGEERDGSVVLRQGRVGDFWERDNVRQLPTGRKETRDPEIVVAS